MRRTVGLIVGVGLAVTSCTARGSDAPSSTPSHVLTRDERWEQDIDSLVTQMEAIHPDLFHGVPKETFDAQVEDLVAATPTLTDDEILVGMMRLVAVISSHGRDGHMGLWPPDNPEAVHRFPVRLWEFPDGLYVTAAQNAGLVGSKVRSVDGVPIREVLQRLDPVVPRDNASNLRDARTVFLTSAEVLTGLGIADDASVMMLETEAPDGTVTTETVDAIGGDAYADWVGGWELLLPTRAHLFFLRDPSAPFWLQYLAPSRTLYVQYNVVEETSAELVQEIAASMQENPVDRVVLDLRNNGGGEAGGYRDLLHLLAGPQMDRRELEVLIGRLTFSAGTSLAVLLEQRAAHVSLLGERSGGAPNFWADPTTVTLPNSGLQAQIADRYEGIAGPGDTRLTVRPDVVVPFTAHDYFSGHDPVLARALGARDT